MAIKELIAAVQTKFDQNKFDKFIHRVHFPRFKNFARGATVDFNFPITILVGPNGGGKSSVLHAAWGMPLNHSTSRFWFSTPVDPIEYDKNDRHRYWYSHYNASLKLRVQTRKIAGNKHNGYWEPSRVAIKEGMDPMPSQTAPNSQYMSNKADRWTPVVRTPYYFNAKNDTSAFDRFFNGKVLSSLEARQDQFVLYTKRLKRVIDNDLQTFDFYGIERIESNSMLSASQLAIVNRILQKKYKSARYISHKLYDTYTFSPSVKFETDARNYSECFAGSGELAVVNLVLALEKLNDFDLLLLDEPETSLHPGAQEKLIEHLLELSRDKCIQVIISTHSQTFVENLPQSALVVLEESSDGIKPRLAPTKASAFERLGVVEKNKVTILTEDRLLQAMVMRALPRVDRSLRLGVAVVADDVGVSEMLSNQVRAHIQANSKVLMVIDGDQKEVESIFNQDVNTLNANQRDATIRKLDKEHKISIVGTGIKEDFVSWMQWCKQRVIAIDQVCPEQVLLELLDPNHVTLSKPNATNADFKKAVKAVLHHSHNGQSMDSQHTIFNLKLGEISPGSRVDGYLNSLAAKLTEKLSQFAN